MDRCLPQSKGRESDISCSKIFDVTNAAIYEHECIIYIESGPVRSCAHRHESPAGSNIYYGERIYAENCPH